MIDFFTQGSFVQVLVAFSIVGLFAFMMILLTAWLSKIAGKTLGGVSASMMSPLGALFGLTAAFLGSTVAANHSDAMVVANTESRSLSEAWIIAQELPVPVRDRVRGDIQAYVDAVVQDEWPIMMSIHTADNPVSERTRLHLLDAVHAVVAVATTTPSLSLSATGDALRNAFGARSQRMDIATRLINGVQLTSTLVLGLLLIALVAIVHHANRPAQILAVSLVSFAVATAIGAIVAQDDPFFGYLAVTAADFAHNASYGTGFTVTLP